MATEFAQIIEPLAKQLLGEPNAAMSSQRELRYGSHGSLSVDLVKGTWYDHEVEEGGGALDLVTRETKLIGQERLDWLKSHGFLFDTIQPNGGERASIIATYDYVDEGGAMLTQVCRFEPKDFRQRRPDGNGGWVWSVKGIRVVPYRLPQLIETGERIVCIVEGEKDVDRLLSLGVPATCNAGGAGKWREELSEFFRDADVVIIPDRDPQKRHQKTGELMFHPDGRPILPGQDHAQAVARSLHGIAARVRLLELWKSWPDMPLKGDASDWIRRGGTAEQLYALIDQLPDWSPDADSETPIATPLPWINTSTWDVDPVPQQDWTVRDRFPRRQCALFSGEGSAGKSTLLLQLCSSTAIARDWLGTVPEFGPSLFIDAEDDADVIHHRLAAVVNHYGTTFKALADGGLHLMSLAGQDAVLATASKGGKIVPTPLYGQLLQAAGDIKPVIFGLASSANFFAGNEVDRAQVQQFISMMTKLAIVANGTTVLISHPSLTGITSDSGMSGSTQWHNAVRARCYIKGVKQEQDETETHSDLREIFWKKSNYGPVSESIVLRWTDGMFLPVRSASGSSFDAMAQAALADDVFIAVLKRLTKENRFVSNKPSANFAPAVFAQEAEAKKAGTGKVALTAAMLRLFQSGVIWNLSYGKPSRGSFRIALKLKE
jgi:RecA-family ATPase